jgi:hypothetical protein
MTEEWKTIPLFTNYQISNFGNVKCVKGNKNRLLQGSKNSKGYLRVNLYDGNGKAKTRFIHNLVGESLLDNFENKSQINHKNENKEDNNILNLEYATNLENRRHGTVIERVARANSKVVIQYTMFEEFVKEWNSVTQISKELNISSSRLYDVVNGKYKTRHPYSYNNYV